MPYVAVGGVVLAVLTALRLYAAFHVPLTADEAYYWSWSLHPAFGYTDHPPMVAWLIGLGRSLGSGAGFVRLPFVMCEAIAALAVGRAAWLISSSARAGTIAMLLFALIPQTKLALGEALPDGAYMAAWGLTLWAAAALDRASSRGNAVALAPSSRGNAVALAPSLRGAAVALAPSLRGNAVALVPSLRIAAGLGVALAAAVLSRTFGWALVAGVIAWSLEPSRRARLWSLEPLGRAWPSPLEPVRRARSWPPLALAFVVVIAAYVPFIVWNATHDWENFGFSFHTRQTFVAFAHLTDASTLRFIAYALLLALTTWFVALRTTPRVTLVAWTALPLPVALLVLSLGTTIESYWIIGPAASVAVGAGIALADARMLERSVLGVLGVATAYATATALFWTLPEAAQARAFAAVPALQKPFATGVYVYAPLAARLRALASADGDAEVLTDRYETAAELLWYGIDARIVTALPQRPQWMRWHTGAPLPQHALLVTFDAPLDRDPALAQTAAAAFAHLTPQAPIALTFAGIPQDVYDVVQLDDPRDDARSFLPGL